jgi:hypothetical protein
MNNFEDLLGRQGHSTAQGFCPEYLLPFPPEHHHAGVGGHPDLAVRKATTNTRRLQA